MDDRRPEVLARLARLEASFATGRITLGLYNCYDPKQWHDIMRITLARVAPVALAFDCNVATFGFPFEQVRPRGAKSTRVLQGPADVAGFVAEGTSIGEGGEAFGQLVQAKRFAMHPFAIPASLGRLVATTPSPDAAKATTTLEIAQELASGRPHLLLYGLGPRGLPADVLSAAGTHLEFTGRAIALETATALGALPAMLHAHLQHLPRSVA